MTIRLAAFDLGGTIVDHGSSGPVLALRAAFQAFGIEVTDGEVRGPMGRGKLDHVREMLAMPRIQTAWRTAQGTEPDDAAAHAIHDRFVPIQVDVARERAHFVGGFPACCSALREAGIAVAVTTGYPRVVGDAILEVIQRDFVPDASRCNDEVEAGRPAPDMILAVMADLDIDDPRAVVAVGDTVPDIAAARAAGCWAVGVAATGSEVGLDESAFAALTLSERAARLERAHATLHDAGADLVIDRVDELPAALERLR